MLTDKEKEIIGKCKIIEDIVEYIGTDEILSKITPSEVVEYYDLDDILDECSFETDIADYLADKGFDFSRYIESDEEDVQELDDYSEDELLIKFCRRLYPRRVLMKEDIREIANDYINDMVNKCY